MILTSFDRLLIEAHTIIDILAPSPMLVILGFNMFLFWSLRAFYYKFAPLAKDIFLLTFYTIWIGTIIWGAGTLLMPFIHVLSGVPVNMGTWIFSMVLLMELTHHFIYDVNKFPTDSGAGGNIGRRLIKLSRGREFARRTAISQKTARDQSQSPRQDTPTQPPQRSSVRSFSGIIARALFFASLAWGLISPWVYVTSLYPPEDRFSNREQLTALVEKNIANTREKKY